MIKYVIEKNTFEPINFKDNSKIPSICYNSTKRCNFCCIHCGQNNKVEELSLEKQKEIIYNLAKNGLVRINFSGGEPLVYDGLFELLKFSKEYGLIVTLSSNGYLINESNVKKIAKYVDNIKFSFYGIGKLHDTVTQKPGSFERLSQSIKVCSKSKIPIFGTFVLMQRNVKDLAKIVDFCQKNHIAKLNLYTLSNKGRAKSIFEDERLNDADIKHINKDLLKIRKQYDQVIIKEVVDYNDDKASHLLVEPNGKLLFLHGTNITHLGSLADNSIANIWDNFPNKSMLYDYVCKIR
jgi:MoaA/NifB/PqqE/SkfB family radical SAM enzyme